MKIIVIGAGIAGLSIGWRLAKSGCEVVILERAAPGRGATWASGGMIAAAAEQSNDNSPEGRLATRAASLWPEFAAEIESASGRSISYRRDGSLSAALSPQDFELLAAGKSHAASVVSGDEARRLEPMLSAEVAGGIWAPGDAQVDNRAVGLALAHAFVNAGGTLQINEAVVDLEYVDGRIHGARTPFALYQGDAFVIAAGAWSGDFKEIPLEFLPPVIPVKGEMIALRPPQGATLPERLVWGPGTYLIPRRDRLIVGATTSREGFDTSLTDEAENRLYRGACDLMPALAAWDIVEHWAGLRPGSPDDLPIFGESALPGLFVASGQYRNGILFAPAIADAMHCLILERRLPPDIDAFDPKRFADRALATDSEVR